MNSKKLYHFLMENECHLYKNLQTNIIFGWVVVNFSDLQEFINIICPLDEHGIKATIKDKYLAIELNDIIENEGEELSDYKECFGSEWEEYFPELLGVAK